MREKLDEIKIELINLGKLQEISFKENENLLKEDLEELKKIFIEGIKEFKEALADAEKYFSDKDRNHLEVCLDKALKGDEKILYATNTLEKKRQRENDVENLLKSQQRQMLAKQLAYKLSVHSYAHPHLAKTPVTKLNLPFPGATEKKTVHDLASVALFSGLEGKELGDIASLIKIKKFSANSTVFMEDDYSKDIYIIKSGRISIRKSFTGELKDEELVILGKGALLGEMAILENERRSATAKIVLGEAELYVIHGQIFLNLMEKYPKISINLNKIYSHRLRETSKKLVTYLHKGVKPTERASFKPLMPQSTQPIIFTGSTFLKSAAEIIPEKEDKNKKSEPFTLSSLKYISLSVKCRRLLYKKDKYKEDNILNLIKYIEKMISSGEGEDSLFQIADKLKNYKSLFTTEITRLTMKELPPDSDIKFKNAKKSLITVISRYKDHIKNLLSAIEGKNINLVSQTKEEIEKTISEFDNYLKIREEIKAELSN